MTIAVRIMNEDPRESAVVVVSLETSEGKAMDGTPDYELTCGMSKTLYVHSGCSIRVRELRQ